MPARSGSSIVLPDRRGVYCFQNPLLRGRGALSGSPGGDEFPIHRRGLMKHRLMESLFYYHMYPPLDNLLVGAVVKAFPNNYRTPLHVLFMAMGLVSAVLLYGLMRSLERPRMARVHADDFVYHQPGMCSVREFSDVRISDYGPAAGAVRGAQPGY